VIAKVLFFAFAFCGYIRKYSLQRETEEKARQPESKLGAMAHTRHRARLRNAEQSRIKNPKFTRGAQKRGAPATEAAR
jgi:hypothetical protein